MYYFGSYLGSGLISYAADEQNSNTNISNVTFEAYFKGDNDQKVYSNEADISSELTLYLAIGVKEGTLKNFKIDFENTNFKLKDGRTKIEATQINATETKEISLPIVAKNDSTFNLDLLNMDNKIKITGKYISNNNETTDLNTEKTISIKWNSSNLTSMTEEERKETKVLSTEIITNKTYTIGETQKRLIQVKVKSGIKNNIYPIEKTIITVNPLEAGEMNEKEFTNGTKLTAEEVNVAAYSTKATNGKDGSANFGKAEENKLGSWQYNSETGITTITINNSKDESNNVAWAKNAVDEFIVTYIYNEESVKNAKAFRTVAENNLKLYTDEGEHKKTARYWETNAEKAMPIELNIQAPESLSKKYISTGKDFKETLTLNISTTKLEKNLFVVSSIDRLNISDEDQTKVKPSTTYKSTYINKEDFMNILGENGEVAILNMSTEEELGKITKDSVDSNNEEMLSFTYPSNVSLIGIQLSNPVKEGKLNIENNKNLNIANVTEYTSNIDKIEKLTLSSLAAIQNIDEEDSVYDTDAQIKEITLTNPETNVELGVDLGQDKTTLPVGTKNTVGFTVSLKTSGENDKLYNNPTVQIKLPEEAKEVAIVKDSEDLAHANGLEFKNWKVNGNTIEIELEGNQAQTSNYDGQDTTITFSAEFSTQKLLPTITRNIDLTVTNGEDQKTNSKQVIFSADKGILLVNSISNYNGTEPSISAFKNEEKSGLLNSTSDKAITATGEATIINNTGNKLENTEIIGKGNIKVAMEGATIAYTKDQEVTKNSNWNVTEYAQDVTGYKITVPTIENAKTVKFTYELTIPANLGANKTIELQYTVYNRSEEIASPKILLLTEQNVKLELNVEPTVKDGENVYEGQALNYNVTVKNTGETEARNVEINTNLSEGLEVKAGTQSSWKIDKLGAGEEITKTIQAKAKNLEESEKEKIITAEIIVKADYLKEELKTTITNKVKASKIRVSIEDGYTDDAIIYVQGKMSYVTKITNTSTETINNLKIVCTLPEETTFKSDYIYLGEEEINPSRKQNGNKIEYSITELGSGSTLLIGSNLVAKALNENESERTVTATTTVEADNIEKYSVSKNDIIVNPALKLEYTSENLTASERNSIVKTGDKIKFNATITNKSKYKQQINVEGNIPDGVIVDSLTQNRLNKKENIEISLKKYRIQIVLEGNESVNIELIATVGATEKDVKIISNIKCHTVINDRDGMGDTVYTNELTAEKEYTLKYQEITPEPEPENPLTPENPDNPNNPDNPDDPAKPDDPVTPNDPTEKIYTISGVAWLDENENGQKESSERLLKGILVKIKQINKDKVAEYLKDENGEDLTAITNNDGEYVFKNLEPGQYILEFKYNTKTYKLTQVANKDSVPYESKTSEGTTVKTDTITIKNSNIGNIDIGLVLNSTFDLELNKYITRAVVQNNAGTTEYKYNNEQLAKLEIKAKQMASSTVFVEYVIEVKNNGAVPGSAQVIADYLPKELKFSSEMNTDWYQGTDGNLYTEKLKDVTIEPGETKQVSLILTKAMTENNTGTFVNAAEIYEDKNEFGLVDTNSTPANQEEKENDYSTAEIMISTATGSPAMYIGIIIACMLILGGGVYMINKKVINGKKSI